MKNNLSKNPTNISQSKINWDEVQSRMKTSFGNDIYESWLRKLNFVEEFKNYIFVIGINQVH